MPDSLVLGIETSCDETSLALVAEGNLLCQTLASQIDLHSIFGGVVPELASREHYRFFGILLDRLFSETGLSIKDVTGIAVARGPGLLGSLLVGVAFAKSLAMALGCRIIGVNHLHAHFLAAGISQKLVYPALGLLVSGGHTILYRINAPDEFVALGRSLDDAAGEAYDKVGNFLGLSYPAGKKIDDLAREGNPDIWHLPRPYLNNDNLDFSFSGLKTAAINLIKEKKILEKKNPRMIEDFCACFNKTVAETLVAKMKRAFLANQDVNSLWLAGGVAANSCIRKGIEELAKSTNLPLVCPEPEFCTDNGAMTAYCGWQLLNMGYHHDLDFEAIPRGQPVINNFKKHI